MVFVKRWKWLYPIHSAHKLFYVLSQSRLFHVPNRQSLRNGQTIRSSRLWLWYWWNFGENSSKKGTWLCSFVVRHNYRSKALHFSWLNIWITFREYYYNIVIEYDVFNRLKIVSTIFYTTITIFHYKINLLHSENYHYYFEVMYN